MLHMDVAKVDLDVATCCISYTCMLQAFVQNVSSVFQTYVAIVISGCCTYFHTDVASVCSKCFIHFRRMHVVSVSSNCCICFTQMLYVFVPNVSSVLDVRYSKFFFVLQVFLCFKR